MDVDMVDLVAAGTQVIDSLVRTDHRQQTWKACSCTGNQFGVSGQRLFL